MEKICQLISEINMSSRINNVPINININCIESINMSDNHDEHNNYPGNSAESIIDNKNQNDEININTPIENTVNPDQSNESQIPIVTPPLSPITYPSIYNNNYANNESRLLNSVNSSFNLDNAVTNSINYNADNYESDFVDNNHEISDNLSDSLPSSYSNLEPNTNIEPRNLNLEKIYNKTKIAIYKNILNADTKCSICNENFKDDDICRINNRCNHHYHQVCIDQWYLDNDKCPICNQYLD